MTTREASLMATTLIIGKLGQQARSVPNHAIEEYERSVIEDSTPIPSSKMDPAAVARTEKTMELTIAYIKAIKQVYDGGGDAPECTL